MTPIRRTLLVSAALAALAVAVASCSGGDGGSEATPGPSASTPAEAPTLDACGEIDEQEDRRACYAEAIAALFEDADDPSVPLEEVTVAAYSDPTGRFLGDCHGLMHTAARKYAAARGITLETLMNFLPQTNEPGCGAGFAHGLVTAVAPDIDLRRPAEAAAVCGDAVNRYREYSCVHGFGHAFMRLVREDLDEALRLCAALGDVRAPDCSQGSFHDYWFAVIGADDTEPPEDVIRDPRELCSRQDDAFVRPCWYRSFIENRPDQPIDDAADIDALCTGLSGLQREACITAVAVVGPPDPRTQLGICQGFEGVEAVACIRGTKVQNLLTASPEELVALVRQCDGFPRETALECYRWLGKVLGVMTNGEFEGYGCRSLPTPPTRRACLDGISRMDEALETFS